MVTAREVDQQALVKKAGEALKQKLSQPEWSLFVKTSSGKERPPEQGDWWYMRSASILRKIYTDGPVGVQRLRTFYGGRRTHRHRKDHFRKAGGKVVRVVMRDLERAGLIEKATKPRKGRVVTREGQRFLDGIAKEVKS